MTLSRIDRQEAFAQALARGVEGREAAREAGYKAPRNWRTLMKNRVIADRLAELRRQRAGGASADVSSLIDWLIEIAEDARAVKDVRGYGVARACLETAAKLKLRRPASEPATRPAASAAQAAYFAELDREVSDEEWMRLYGPEAPGGKVGDGGP
ncbi:MAG TPA: hypothetical protein VII63_02920 [Caulobacteraceae bacterium]